MSSQTLENTQVAGPVVKAAVKPVVRLAVKSVIKPGEQIKGKEARYLGNGR